MYYLYLPHKFKHMKFIKGRDQSKKLYDNYVNYLAGRNIKPDDDQKSVLKELSRYLCSSKPLFRKPLYSGVYIWGPPGRGKSMLMDTCMRYFDGPKIRIHFHEFMYSVNKKLFTIKGSSDALPQVILEWFKPYKLVCFDEFHVHDIADSVLAGAFIKTITSKKCVLTSNYMPDKLFPDPLYRGAFLPSIELIKKRFNIMPLINYDDYRLRKIPDNVCFFDTDMHDAIITHLSEKDPSLTVQDGSVTLSGRGFKTFAQGDNTICMRFRDICGADSSYIDYLEFSIGYDTLFLSDITEHDFDSRNAMLRFVWLLDVLYDKKIRLYCTSEKPLIDMVRHRFNVNDADRCVSRLSEMRHAVHLVK